MVKFSNWPKTRGIPLKKHLLHSYLLYIGIKLCSCNSNNPIYNVYTGVKSKLATALTGSIYTEGPFGL